MQSIFLAHSKMASRNYYPLLHLHVNIIFFFLFIHIPITSSIFDNQTDQLALFAFKEKIIEDPLQILTSWNNSATFCRWEGVTCSQRRPRVTELNLESWKLRGSLSPSIANLTFLKVINLRGNNFYGQIPQDISNLFRLEYLLLTENSFEGETPANISRCSQLKVIHLNFNKLSGKIPKELGILPKLVALHIAANNLTGGIPPSFGNLSSLLNLSLARNNLGGSIPDDLGRLANLKMLQLGSAHLTGMIPSSMFNLSKITQFGVADNQLVGSFPQSFGSNLPNLQLIAVGVNNFSGSIPFSLSNASGLLQIDFPDNSFSGKMPTDLGSLKNLHHLNVGRNQLGDGDAQNLNFIDSLINCSKLEMLGIDSNKFSGPLPNSIANLSMELKTLILRDNLLNGSIPFGIINFVKLTSLYVDWNEFDGLIPTQIGKLSSLRRLYMNHNRFSGLIPPSLGNMTELFELRLDRNNLQGSIPSSLGNCLQMQLLILGQNNLSGSIPVEVIGLRSLTVSLNLAQNSLEGSLPPEIDNLKSLKELDVSDNNLSDNIPSALGNCLSLEQLFIEGNLFRGTIPSTLSALRGLQDLDLSRNNLSGKIPDFLKSFVFLRYLNLSFNDFEGEVPKEGVFTNISLASVSGNSKLCGGNPSLKLPLCYGKQTKRQGKHISLKLIVAIISGAAVLAILLYFLVTYIIRRSRRNHTLALSSIGQYLHISYRDLEKATCGFSPTNLIGKGSFGSVYKGTLNQDERLVAVKVLNLQQKEASKIYMAECEALSNTRHRNLVRILSSCSSLDTQGNDFRALVLEFMPNGSLENWLHPESGEQNHQRKLSILQRLNIAIDVAFALEYLHNHCQVPIIHCDLKPSNVLLDADMCARVSDFGLAKFLQKSGNGFAASRSSSVGIRGSIGYIAPEYGMGGQSSTQGDVYSYGILLLELFTGRRPTDNSFKEGVNLHNFAKAALPKQVMDIIDPALMLQLLHETGHGEEEEETESMKRTEFNHDDIEQCLLSTIRIGVACSATQPQKRMDMKDVANKLHVIQARMFKYEFL